MYLCPRFPVGEKNADGVDGGGGVVSRRGGRMKGRRGAVEEGVGAAGRRDGVAAPPPLGRGRCGWGSRGEEEWGARCGGGVVGGVGSSSEGEDDDDITMASSAAPREEVGCGRLTPRGGGSAASNWEVDGRSSVGIAASSSSSVSWSEEEGSSSISSFRRAAGRRVSGDECWGVDCGGRLSLTPLGRGVEKLNLGVGANWCCEGEGWVEEKRRDEEGAFWEGRDLGGAKRWGDGVWRSCQHISRSWR